MLVTTFLVPIAAVAQTSVIVDRMNQTRADGLKPFVAFCSLPKDAKKSSGHAFAIKGAITVDGKLRVEAGNGFYSIDGGNWQYLVTPGHLENEALGSLPQTACRLVVLMNNTDVYDTAVADWKKKEHYSLTVQDCVSFVRDLAQRIGLNVPLRIEGLFPPAFIEALTTANPGKPGPIIP